MTQVRRCAQAWIRPEDQRAAQLVADQGGRLVRVDDRAVVVDGLDEQSRILVQHTLGFQVHDVTKPHHYERHGRADIGWPTTATETGGELR